MKIYYIPKRFIEGEWGTYSGPSCDMVLRSEAEEEIKRERAEGYEQGFDMCKVTIDRFTGTQVLEEVAKAVQKEREEIIEVIRWDEGTHVDKRALVAAIRSRGVKEQGPSVDAKDPSPGSAAHWTRCCYHESGLPCACLCHVYASYAEHTGGIPCICETPAKPKGKIGGHLPPNDDYAVRINELADAIEEMREEK